MTQTHKLLTLALAATLAFAACDKDDNSGKQIEWMEDYYYSSSSRSTDGRFHRTRFSWEGGQLRRLEYFDADNQRVIYYIEIVYEDGKAKEVRGYDESGKAWESATLSATLFYTDDKITSIQSSSYAVTYEYNSAGELVKVTGSDGSTTTFLWENGNIVEERHEDRITTYTYDNKTNPYHSACIVAYLGEPGARMLSRNNIVSETYTSGDYESRDEYSYTYDGDYPTTVTSNTSDGKDVTYFRYTDGSGMSAPDMCHIKIEDGYEDHESRPYYVYGVGTYAKGDKVIISTDADYFHDDTFYIFSHWSDGNTDNPRTFTATADVTLRPVYTAAEY
ncbi:MAG: hypothetical protein J6I49_08245 [Bacteroidales bacterium]|nr:hypothetical protein [Bacteroidales bacterium]